MSSNENRKTAQSWDTYWQGTGDVAAFSAGGVEHPAITSFWTAFFSELVRQGQPVRLLDIATGNGALLDLATTILDPDNTRLSCVDISRAAIENVAQRFPRVRGVVADALSLPMESAQFDVVTSQFGVEYAGLGAIPEAARMVAPRGRLVLMLHVVDGLVHRECQASLTAIERLQAAKFVPLAKEFFKHGFAAVRGADRRAYDDAGTRLAPAIQAAEAIMQEFGAGVAGDTISGLYANISRMHSNLPRYDPDDVRTWLETHELELVRYAERMSSMMKSALSSDDFRVAAEQLQATGFALDRLEPLAAQDTSATLAWILVASR